MNGNENTLCQTLCQNNFIIDSSAYYALEMTDVESLRIEVYRA